MELYNLETDLGETTDLAKTRPKIVDRIATFMDQAVTPNDRYQIGTTYKGKAIWKKDEPQNTQNTQK